jgi:predicted ester cyclase
VSTADRAGLLKSIEAARRAFPDVKPEIIAEIGEGEWVAIAVTVDGGTQQGTYMRIPETGRPVIWTETRFWRVTNGKIIEHHGNVSMFEIHKMIGSRDLHDKLN